MLYEVYNHAAVRIKRVKGTHRTEPLKDWRFDFTDGFNILNWAILHCKLQGNARNQKGKDKFLWDCFHCKIKSKNGGH